MTKKARSQSPSPPLAGGLEYEGKIAYLSALGKRAPDGPPMDEQTIFRIYSMTKPLTSVLAMMLFEEGKLSLAAPVHSYLPEYKEMAVAVGSNSDNTVKTEPAKRPMRVHDLLRHSAGLTYGFFGTGPAREVMAKADFEKGDKTNREIARAIAKMPLEHQPGKVWEYSRATDVLGAVIEVVEGTTLGESMKSRIFEPLGMNDTSFNMPDTSKHNRIAEPFQDDRKIGRTDLFDPRIKRQFESGGGGLMSTIHEYTRFAQMMMNGGEIDGFRLLAPATVDYMTSDHLGNKINRAPITLPTPHWIWWCCL